MSQHLHTVAFSSKRFLVFDLIPPCPINLICFFPWLDVSKQSLTTPSTQFLSIYLMMALILLCHVSQTFPGVFPPINIAKQNLLVFQHPIWESNSESSTLISHSVVNNIWRDLGVQMIHYHCFWV
jgi:cytochrome bd-type quinol oxidase subunit 2